MAEYRADFREDEVRTLLLGATIEDVIEHIGFGGAPRYDQLVLRLDSGHTVRIVADRLSLSAEGPA